MMQNADKDQNHFKIFISITVLSVLNIRYINKTSSLITE